MNNTLQDLVNTQPGSYFSGSFQASVSECKSINTKTGKTFYKATLTEGGVEVSAMSFSRDLSPFQGKVVKFTGSGIKRGDDFQGKPQVTVGDKSIISQVGVVTQWAAPVPTQPAPSVTGMPTPYTQSSRIEGVTVGMAINKAVDICIKTGEITEENLWHWSSSLIRLAQKLQAGKLAEEEYYKIVENPSDEQPY